MNEIIEFYEETLKNISERIAKLESQLNEPSTYDESSCIHYRISILETEYSELCNAIHEMKSR
jgi:hypothetical protein